MSKFCNNKPKAIISSIKQKPDVIEMVTAGIEGGNTLTVLGILQSPYFVGVIPLEAEAKISYCPMCGEKLREDYVCVNFAKKSTNRVILLMPLKLYTEIIAEMTVICITFLYRLMMG